MPINKILKSLVNPGDTGGMIPPSAGNIGMSTNLFVSVPESVPGCNIGKYVINESVNRMLARGITPRYAALSFTLDMDFTLSQAAGVADAVRQAAVEAEVEIAAVDYKVLPDGPPTGIDVNVTLMGEVPADLALGAGCIHSSDSVIITGPVGAHGVACSEQSMGGLFFPPVGSDSCPLSDIVHSVMRIPDGLRMMYYPSGESLREACAVLESVAGHPLVIDTDKIPVDRNVSRACRWLDVNPLDMVSAGVIVVVVEASCAEKALDAVKRSAFGAQAAVIGHF